MAAIWALRWTRSPSDSARVRKAEESRQLQPSNGALDQSIWPVYRTAQGRSGVAHAALGLAVYMRPWFNWLS